jgi:hypothetical protein
MVDGCADFADRARSAIDSFLTGSGRSKRFKFLPNYFKFQFHGGGGDTTTNCARHIDDDDNGTS